jgi:hypothetical protein
MVKKRAKVSDSATEMGSVNPDLFAATSLPPEPVERKPDRVDRVLYRASYDMTEDLKRAVATRATRLGIPASQLAMFLLSDALRRFDTGEIDPLPFVVDSTSPKFRYNLEIDPAWYFEG